MRTLIQRSFIVEVPVDAAWAHLARVEDWPSWARHISRIDLRPSGLLGPDTTGVIRLRNGIRSAFSMSGFDPPRSWTWTGRFLWLRVRYEHAFAEVDPKRSLLTWTVSASGFAVSTLGGLFAAIYRRDLDRAIPRLTEEMSQEAV
jgi:hypothetical protein